MKLKISILIILFIFAGSAILYFTGAFHSKELDINELAHKENIAESITMIHIEMDSTYVGTFDITDQTELDHIFSILKERVYKIDGRGSNPSPGSNTTLTFVYENGTEIELGIYTIKSSNGFNYTPESRDGLESYLEGLGLEKGLITER